MPNLWKLLNQLSRAPTHTRPHSVGVCVCVRACTHGYTRNKTPHVSQGERLSCRNASSQNSHFRNFNFTLILRLKSHVLKTFSPALQNRRPGFSHKTSELCQKAHGFTRLVQIIYCKQAIEMYRFCP